MTSQTKSALAHALSWTRKKGKPSTGIAVYTALLWTYDLLRPFGALADPLADSEGFFLDNLSGRERARSGKGLDNDF